jgi:hypothetical protein
LQWGLVADFGSVMREKRINPLTATSAISFAALLTYAPLYLLLVGVDRDRERERHREHLFMERHCWKSREAFRKWHWQHVDLNAALNHPPPTAAVCREPIPQSRHPQAHAPSSVGII